MALSLAASCGGPEPDPVPTPVDPTPAPAKDTKAPVITVSTASVNVIAGVQVTLGASDLKLGEAAAATWTDDISKTCKAELSFTPAEGTAKTVNS